jgi:hypothetical protein
VFIQLTPPDSSRNDPGSVAIGFYTHYSNGTVDVYNEQDHPIGSGHIEPGGDAAAAARAVMRRKLH